MGYQKRRRYQRYRFDSRCQVRYNRVADNLLESDESFALNRMKKFFRQRAENDPTRLGRIVPTGLVKRKPNLWSSFEDTGATVYDENTGLRSEVDPNKVWMFISMLATSVMTEKEFVAVDFVSLGPTAPCRIFLRPPNYG